MHEGRRPLRPYRTPSVGVQDEDGARRPGGPVAAEAVLALQRCAGNAAVAALAGRRLQRKVAPADLSKKPAGEIMGDETYFEADDIERFEFFDAESARITYKGGAKLTFGLLPETLTPPSPPIDAVDYRSTDHGRLDPQSPGRLRFLPHGIKSAPPPGPHTKGKTLEEVMAPFSREITFKHDTGSGRIVPSEVNSLTAPRLCEGLRLAEAEYIKDMDAIAKGATKVLNKLGWIVTLSSLRPGPKGGRVSAATKAQIRAESRLADTIGKWLKPGGTKATQFTVEGVGIGGFEVAAQGESLVVRYTHIINTGRVAKQGRMIQAALERAAITAARKAGLKTAEVGVSHIQNAAWRAYLESSGYVMRQAPHLDGSIGWTAVWTRVLPI